MLIKTQKLRKRKSVVLKSINKVNAFKSLMKELLGLTSITNSWYRGIFFKSKQNGISGKLLNL